MYESATQQFLLRVNGALRATAPIPISDTPTPAASEEKEEKKEEKKEEDKDKDTAMESDDKEKEKEESKFSNTLTYMSIRCTLMWWRMHCGSFKKQMHLCMSIKQLDFVYSLGQEVPKLVYAFWTCKPVNSNPVALSEMMLIEVYETTKQ